MTISEIAAKIERLSPQQREEVEQFVNKLANPNYPSFSWEGALEDIREEYTSVELQHKASEWMAASALRGTSLDLRNAPGKEK
ncbi:MAG TPA: DUF2281 domain-containing protein [Candidatus Kapabacteria bacterium]|jgi:hypothetical protein|nr:DUF2281 domain-containing protein [Candidatus Kapabacteria bacterium]